MSLILFSSRPEADDNARVFLNSNVAKVEPRAVNKWLKANFIKPLNMINEMQLKKLTSKAWRKVYKLI